MDGTLRRSHSSGNLASLFHADTLVLGCPPSKQDKSTSGIEAMAILEEQGIMFRVVSLRGSYSVFVSHESSTLDTFVGRRRVRLVDDVQCIYIYMLSM